MRMAMPEPAISGGAMEHIVSSMEHLFIRLQRCEENFSYISTIRDAVLETKEIVQGRNKEIEELRNKNSELENRGKEVTKELKETSSIIKVLQECLFKMPEVLQLVETLKAEAKSSELFNSEKFNSLKGKQDLQKADIETVGKELRRSIDIIDEEVSSGKMATSKVETQCSELVEKINSLRAQQELLNTSVETTEKKVDQHKLETDTKFAEITNTVENNLELGCLSTTREQMERMLDEYRGESNTRFADADKKFDQHKSETDSQFSEITNSIETLGNTMDNNVELRCRFIAREQMDKMLDEFRAENDTRFADMRKIYESWKFELSSRITETEDLDSKLEEFQKDATSRFETLEQKSQSKSGEDEYEVLRKKVEDFQKDVETRFDSIKIANEQLITRTQTDAEEQYHLKEIQKQVDIMTLAFEDCKSKFEGSAGQNVASASTDGTVLQKADRNILHEINNVQQIGEDLNACLKNELMDVDITVAELKVLQEKIAKDVEDNAEDIKDIQDKNRLMYKKMKDAKEDSRLIDDLERKVRTLQDDLEDVIRKNRDIHGELNTLRSRGITNETNLQLEQKEVKELKELIKTHEDECLNKINDLKETEINSLQQKISKIDIDLHSKFHDVSKKISDSQKEIETIIKTRGDNNPQLQKVAECVEMTLSCQNMAFANKKDLNTLQKDFESFKDTFIAKQKLLQEDLGKSNDIFASKEDLNLAQNEIHALKDLINEKDKLDGNKLDLLKQSIEDEMNQEKLKLLQLETDFENRHEVIKTTHQNLANQVEQHEKTFKDIHDVDEKMNIEISEISNEVALTKDEISNDKVDVLAINNQIALTKDEISNIKVDVLAANNQISLTKDEISNIKGDVLATNNQVALTKDEISNIRADILASTPEVASFKEQLTKEIEEIRLGSLLSAEQYQGDGPVVQLLHKVLKSLKDSVKHLREDEAESKGQIKNLSSRCDGILEQMIGMNESCKMFEIAIQELKKATPSSSRPCSRASSHAGGSRENSVVVVVEDDQPDRDNSHAVNNDRTAARSSDRKIEWNFF